MFPLWVEIAGSFLIIIVGLVYILKVIYTHKAGRKIFDTYSDISEERDLDVKNSLNLLSNWPNLYGEIGGKEVYVHPNKGKGKRPAKTIFAVGSDVDLSEDIIVGASEAEIPEESHELDAKNLKKYKYKVYSEGDYGDEFVEDLFSKKVSRDINKLIDKNEDDFRALILEPGIVMYSTFGIEIDKENILDNLEKLSDVCKELEKKVSTTSEGVESERLVGIRRGTVSTPIKWIFPILLFVIAGYLFYQVLDDFSFLFLNTGMVLAVIGILKSYVLAYAVRRYQ